MTSLGSGLHAAGHHEEAISVQRAELSIERRRGAPESQMLATLERLANTYRDLGRHELALGIRREAYSARLKVEGEEDRGTIIAALNYGESLVDLQRCAEAKLMLPKMMRAARRVLGNSHDYTLTTRRIYAEALYKDSDAGHAALSRRSSIFKIWCGRIPRRPSRSSFRR